MDALLLPAGGVAVLLLTALATFSRRSLFWLAIVPAFVPIEYIDRYHVDLPSLVKWAPLFFVLFAGAASALLLPRLPVHLPRGFLAALGGLLLVSVVSLLANDSSVGAFVVAQRGWIVVLAAMVALKSAHGLYDKDELYGLMVRLGLVSCAICVLQRLFVIPGVADEDAGDRVTGLFSVGYITLFFHLNCMGIVLAYWLRGRRVVPWPTGLVLLAFLVALGVANQKAAIGFLVALVVFVAWRSGLGAVLRHKTQLLYAALLGPLLLFGLFGLIYDRDYNAESEATYAGSITDPEYVGRYLFGDEETIFTSSGVLRRGAAVQFAYEHVAGSRLHTTLGLGPGATAESRIPGANGSLATLYPGYNVGRVGLSMILGDLGLLGLAAHLVVLLAICRSRVTAGGTEPPEQAVARQVFAFVTASFLWYGNIYNEPVFALLAALTMFPVLAPARSKSPAAVRA